jgi:hypothetical protein
VREGSRVVDVPAVGVSGGLRVDEDEAEGFGGGGEFGAGVPLRGRAATGVELGIVRCARGLSGNRSTYSNDDSRVGSDLSRYRDVHLEIGRVCTKASDLLKRSRCRASGCQDGSRSRRNLHDAEFRPLIRFGEFFGGGGIFLEAS